MNRKNAAGWTKTFIPAALLLGLGALPYLLWNHDALFLSAVRDRLPHFRAPAHTALSDFARYNFPDGAWFLSLLLAQRAMNAPPVFEYLALSLATCLELGQYFHWLPGTFDIADLFLYIILFILFKRFKPCTPKE